MRSARAPQIGRVAYGDELGPLVLPVNYELDHGFVLIQLDRRGGGDGGSQSLALGVAQEGFVEVSFPEPGHYPFVYLTKLAPHLDGSVALFDRSLCAPSSGASSTS